MAGDTCLLSSSERCCIAGLAWQGRHTGRRGFRRGPGMTLFGAFAMPHQKNLVAAFCQPKKARPSVSRTTRICYRLPTNGERLRTALVLHVRGDPMEGLMALRRKLGLALAS